MRLVSVLVPIYNAEKFIVRCAKSLFEQTFSDIEFIFLNDCSSDNSIKILEEVLCSYPKCKERTKIICNDRNMGVAFSRNRLLNNAYGKYVYFVDSDDYLVLDAIEKMYDQAIKENADIVSCNYYEDNGKSQKIVYQKTIIDKKTLLVDAIKGMESIQSMWKLFIKKDLFDNHNIKFDLNINVCEDYIVTIKLFYYQSKIVYIAEPLYYYTVQINITSLTKNVRKAQEDKISSVNIVEEFLLRMGQYEEYIDPLLVRKLICKQTYLIGQDNIDLNRYYSIFPEANAAWRKLNYGPREVVLFWLAEYNFYFFIRFLFFLNKSFGGILKRIW